MYKPTSHRKNNNLKNPINNCLAVWISDKLENMINNK